MQSKKNVKSDEESLAKKTLETSDYVGLKEICPFQDQAILEVHCRSDCAWYSLDRCAIWDVTSLLRRIASQQETANTR
jgi:hypothetical protein